MERVLKIHIDPEFDKAITVGWEADKDKVSKETYIRRACLASLEPQLVAWSMWIRNGRVVGFQSVKGGKSSVEEVELEEDEEASFAKFEDVKPSDAESVVVEIKFPDFMYEKALNAASYTNAYNRELNRRNKNDGARIFPTVGTWFKEIVFVNAFPLEVEQKQRLDALDAFEKSEGKRPKGGASPEDNSVR